MALWSSKVYCFGAERTFKIIIICVSILFRDWIPVGSLRGRVGARSGAQPQRKWVVPDVVTAGLGMLADRTLLGAVKVRARGPAAQAFALDMEGGRDSPEPLLELC